MARIVLATLGSLGDLYPFLGLGLALAKRGHAITIATHEVHRRHVPASLTFAPLRPDLPDDPAFHARFMDRDRGAKFAFSEFLSPAIEQTYIDLLAITLDADLLVSQSLVLAAPLVAATTGIRWRSAMFQPFTLFSAFDPPRLPWLPFLRGGRPWQIAFNQRLLHYARNFTRLWVASALALRDRLGVAGYGHPIYEGQAAPQGSLALFPPLYGTPQPDWPPHTVQTGAISYLPKNDAPLPREIEDFLAAGPAPLIFTLGASAGRAAGDFFKTATAIAERLHMRALLMGDSDTVPLPPALLRTSFVSYAEIFPRSAAIIHAGGIGTSLLALGKPQLLIPFAHDQHDNALRLQRQGLAHVIPIDRFTVRRGTAALRDLLATPVAMPVVQDGTAVAVATLEAALVA